MLPRKWLMTGAGMGFVLASGFALGVSFGGRGGPAASVAEPPKTAPSPAPAHDSQASRQLMDEELKNSQLRQRVAELQRELQKAREGAPAGGQAAEPVRLPPRAEAAFRAAAPGAGSDKPLAFPKNAPEQYTPEGFEKVALKAAKECGMGLDVVALDCSEFPCIAWTEAKDDTVKRFSMEGCGPWEQAFQNGTVVVVAMESTDGGPGKRYFSWMAVPPDPTDLLISVKRAKERNREMRAALGVP